MSHDPTILAACTEKGGAGKTTMITSLAVEYIARGFTVLMVDLDPQKSAAKWAAMGKREGQTVPALLMPGLDDFKGPILNAAPDFDRILVDAPGRHGRVISGVLAIADIFVMPTIPGRKDIWATRATHKIALGVQAKRPELQVKAMLSKVDRRRALSKTIRGTLVGLGIEVLASELTMLADFDECTEEGQGPTTYNPKGKAARDVRNLCDELETLRAGAVAHAS